MPENFFDLFLENGKDRYIARTCLFITFEIAKNKFGKWELFVNGNRLPALTEFESLQSAKRMASTIHLQIQERLNSIYLGKD